MTTALTVPVSDMQAILDGRQWLYLAPETVREFFDGDTWYPFDPNLGLSWDEAMAECPTLVRERSVPVVPPAPVTCPPDCGGWNCPRCGGSGTVPSPLLLCTKQWRYLRQATYEWSHWVTSGVPSYDIIRSERRPAGLVLVPQPTYVTVKNDWSVVPEPYVYTHPRHPFARLWLNGRSREITDEPYAPLLEHGGLLVMWDRAEVLDPPIVEMACLCPSIREGSLRGFTGRMVRRPDLCSACPPETPGRVPLSVGTGFTTVEVPS